MAKVHLDRLVGKFGWAGQSYRWLMGKIIEANHLSIQRAVGRKLVGFFSAQADKIKGQSNKQILVPDLTDVLPKHSVFARKGAERGEILTDSVRTQLANDLRQTVSDYLSQGGQKMQYQIGAKKGRIKPELVNVMERRIRQTFEGYTRRTGGEAPANLRTIAETETRSAISDIKHQYVQRLQDKNHGRVQVMKRWIHHASSQPREGHIQMAGKTAGMDETFNVPDIRGGRLIQVTPMLHPHDPNAPASQVINCHCEIDYVVAVL